MLLKKARNLTLTAYEQIKQMMFDYDIVPGQRLVFIDLAKQLNVSRTPVNNALSILAREGYLDFTPNQGYRVSKLTLSEAESLHDIRELMETSTIGKAIRSLTDEKVVRLAESRTNYENAIKDYNSRKLFVLDIEFHGSIIDFVENRFLSSQYRELCHKIFLCFHVEKLQLQCISDTVKEHKELFQSIKIKDVDRTLELIKNHNKNARLQWTAQSISNEWWKDGATNLDRYDGRAA